MFNIQPKTKQEIKRDAALAIAEHARVSVENAKSNYQIAFDKLWHDPLLTPQEVCDACGSEAYRLFESAMTWIGVIVALDPTWQYPPAPNEFTINPDGTVTIGEPINPEE